MTEVIGTRYCEPSKMKPAEKYNSIKKTSLQFCVQGTFIPEGYERGTTNTRWQTVDELVAAISHEDFEYQSSEYIKELQKSFKRDAKRFKTAAQLAPRLLQDPPGHQGGSRKSGHVRNLARFPHFTAQLPQRLQQK
jgi:hypothetical protein